MHEEVLGHTDHGASDRRRVLQHDREHAEHRQVLRAALAQPEGGHLQRPRRVLQHARHGVQRDHGLGVPYAFRIQPTAPEQRIRVTAQVVDDVAEALQGASSYDTGHDHSVHRPTNRHHGHPHEVDIWSNAQKIAKLGLLDYVADLTSLVETMETPPIIVGHSIGALLAQLLAARVPNRGVILLGTGSTHRLDHPRTQCGDDDTQKRQEQCVVQRDGLRQPADERGARQQGDVPAADHP